MKGISSIFKKGEIAFTALESAIVMTAFLVIAVFFAAIFLMTSCNDDGSEAPGVAPTIPPSSSFEMDFNEFPVK